jgi:ankyrin repeat protein
MSYQVFPQVVYMKSTQKTKDAMVEAAGKNDLASLNHFLKNGISPNATFRDGYSALMAACQGGALEAALILLRNGADPNLGDSIGRTPLSYAVREGILDLTKLLLSYGADVNAQIRKDSYVFAGFGILHFAVLGNSLAVVQELVKSSADINALDELDETPLMKAAILGNSGITKFLLDMGSETEQRNIDGLNATQLAESKGRTRLSKLIDLRTATSN